MTSLEGKERAAAAIDPRSLDEARGAVEARCRLFLTRLDRLERGLSNVRTAPDAGRFARALSMYLLASLPLRPETCPFCVQHSGGNRCGACGYAEIHGGRCDADASAFGQLIEAVIDLAGDIHAIREDPPTGAVDPEVLEKRLKGSIDRSREAAGILLAGIAEADVSELMEAKRDYIERILNSLPAEIIDWPHVDRSIDAARAKLERYW